jgi:hypothetical protein
LSAQTVLTETVTHKQIRNWLEKYYAMEREERLLVNNSYVLQWRLMAAAVLRWDKLYALKGNSPTLPPSFAGCAHQLVDRPHRMPMPTRGGMPLYGFKTYRIPP